MIILDTSFLISFLNRDDSNNQRALKLIKQIAEGHYGDILITDYIFNECATILGVRIKNFRTVLELCELISLLDVIKINEECFSLSWEIFRKQGRYLLSFTDCSIIAFAEKNGIEYIATFDDDFKKIKGIKIID